MRTEPTTTTRWRTPRAVWWCFLPPLSICLLAPWLAHDGHAVNLDLILAPPGPGHWLGCDALGRDVWSRLAEGVYVSLGVGLLVVCCGALFGTTIGLLAGWHGGWIDLLLMRIADVVLSFPGILLAIALAAMLGAGIGNLVLALVAVGWVGFARLSRVQVMSLRQSPWVESLRACGLGLPAIAFRHLLPNIAAPLLIEASFGLAGVMIAEAGLSFLGIGVQPPTASLGSMIREGTRMMLTAPWLVIWPGLLLLLLVMAVNLLGDALRDHLDVRGKQQERARPC